MAIIASVALAFSLAQPVAANAAPAGTISGVVSTPGAAPLQGSVTVELHVINSFITLADSVVADAATGSYSFTAAPGNYTLRFVYSGTGNYLTSWLGEKYRVGLGTTFSLADGATATKNYVIPVGGVVSGTITGDGVPIGTATVHMGYSEPSWVLLENVPTVTVDQATGEFSITRVQPITPNVYGVEACGGSGWRCAWIPDVAVTAGSTVSGLAFDLETANGIAGTVTETNGSPVSLPVYLYAQSSTNPGHYVASMWSDADGEYEFADLEPGVYAVCFGDYWWSMYARECWNNTTFDNRTPIVLGDDVVAGIDEQLKKAGKITGTVKWVDDGGVSTILPNAQVTLLDVDNPTDPDARVTYTDNAGKFEFVAVQPGTYIARVRWTAEEPWLNTEYWQDAWFIQDARPVVVTGDDTDALGTIVLDERTLISARVSGPNRFATAVRISQTFFPEENPDVPVVYIANGLNYPDALAAGPAAAIQGGVLLTVFPDSLPADTAAELDRLNPDKVIIVGGVPSVNNSVKNAIGAIVGSSNVVRIGGADRFETGRLIVQDAFDSLPQGEVYIATGLNYPDALSAGPAAASRKGPVILVNGSAGSLDDATIELLESLHVTRITLVGGYNMVSEGVEESIVEDYIAQAGYYVNLGRIAGANRYMTSNMINEDAFGGGQPFDTAFVAVGTNFADALTGGPLAGDWRSPLFLSPTECLNPGVIDLMLDKEANLMVLLGGEPSLSSNVANFGWCQ